MKDLTIQTIVRQATLAAIYIALTYVSHIFGLDSKAIQFRISDALILLCFFNIKHTYGICLGTFLWGFFMGLGPLDAFLGTGATIIASVCIYKSKNLFISSLFPVIITGIVIGLELYLLFPEFVYKDSLWLTMLAISIGQFVVISIFGILLFSYLRKNNAFMDLIECNEEKTLKEV